MSLHLVDMWGYYDPAKNAFDAEPTAAARIPAGLMPERVSRYVQ